MSTSSRKSFTRKPVFSADVQRLGGVVRVVVGRDRIEGEPRYQVVHVSRGGDCCWRSPFVESEDEAHAGARLLSRFVGAELVT